MALSIVLIFITGLTGATILLGRAFRQRGPVSEAVTPQAAAVVAASRRRALGSIGVAAALLAGMIILGSSFPSLLGLPLALAPLVATTGALLFYAAIPVCPYQLAAKSPRSAPLEARSAWSHAQRGTILLPATTAAILVTGLLATGLTASTDSGGRSRLLSYETQTTLSSASPYPGWFYAIPMLIGTGALLVATFLALRHISSSPAFPAAELQLIDRQWRFGSTRIIAAISMTGLLVTLGGTALFAGNAIYSVHSSANGIASLRAVGPAILIAGIVLILGATLAITLAGTWSIELSNKALASSANTLQTKGHRTGHNPYLGQVRP